MKKFCIFAVLLCYRSCTFVSGSDDEGGIGSFNEKPAFFATLSGQNLNLVNGSILKFERVITNLQNGYSPITGMFTASTTGVYTFAAIFMNSGNDWLELNLMRNNEFIVRGHSSNHHGTTGSIQVILELRKGDIVYLRHPRSAGSIYGDNYGSFSGHML